MDQRPLTQFRETVNAEKFFRYVDILGRLIHNPDETQQEILKNENYLMRYWTFYMRQIAGDLDHIDLVRAIDEVEMLVDVNAALAQQVLALYQKYFSEVVGVEKDQVAAFVAELETLSATNKE